MIPRALARLRERGVDVDALVRRVGLPADSERRDEVAVSPEDFERLMSLAARTLGDPLVALRLPGELDWPSYHVGELAAQSSPTLREALERVVRYASLFYAYLVFTCEVADGELVVRHRQRHSVAGGRYGNEYALGAVLHHARRIAGVELRPSRVWFAHRRGDLDALRAHFGTSDVELGRIDSGLAIPEPLADLPSMAQDPRLLATAERLADRALADQAPDADLVGAALVRIRRALASGGAEVGAIAETFRMSPRTLQRRLADQGTRFSDLVTRARRDLACELLRDPTIPTAEVAFRAGFADPAAFRRAFKRWTGATPSAYRGARARS